MLEWNHWVLMSLSSDLVVLFCYAGNNRDRNRRIWIARRSSKDNVFRCHKNKAFLGSDVVEHASVRVRITVHIKLLFTTTIVAKAVKRSAARFQLGILDDCDGSITVERYRINVETLTNQSFLCTVGRNAFWSTTSPIWANNWNTWFALSKRQVRSVHEFGNFYHQFHNREKTYLETKPSYIAFLTKN